MEVNKMEKCDGSRWFEPNCLKCDIFYRCGKEHGALMVNPEDFYGSNGIPRPDSNINPPSIDRIPYPR